MGVPNSEVGYTAAMHRREDHEIHKDMWWGHWTEKNIADNLRISFQPHNGTLSKYLIISFYVNDDGGPL